MPPCLHLYNINGDLLVEKLSDCLRLQESTFSHITRNNISQWHILDIAHHTSAGTSATKETLHMHGQ